MKYLDENLTAIELEEIGPSSVLVFVDEKTQRPGHIALFTGKGTIIHAILNDQVVEEELGDYWRGRLLCAYNIPGAE